MFSSSDALIVNSLADTQNIKNTINLRNANLQQGKQTRAIVKLKELKKRKTMESSQREASTNVSTSKCYDAISRDVQVKRLRERIEFAVNQLRLAIPEQKEAINHSLTYIRKACDESIENSIQKQINLLQSQTNNKLEIILQLMQQNA
jgi:vacuolar-type H+-ATPase subunit C/Vma6